MKKKFGLLVIALGIMFGSTLLTNVAMAESGGWVGEAGSGGGGGGGGGDGGSCTANDNRYRADCAGSSWIYYEAKAKTTEAITFAPLKSIYQGASGSRGTIPATCSEQHNGSFGGVWHYGINGTDSVLKSMQSSYPSISAGNYITKSGYWGHWWTVLYGAASWITNTENLKNKNTGSDISVYQALTDSSGKIIYEASGTPSSGTIKKSNDSALLEAYKKAYYGATGKEYTGSSLPTGIYAFCFWESDPDPGDDPCEDDDCCNEEDCPPEERKGYYTISNASNRPTLEATSGGWVHTKLNEVGDGVDVVYTDDREYTLEDGKNVTVDITFSHNIYSSDPNDGMQWRVYRDISYSITGGAKGTTSGFPSSTSYYNYLDPSTGTAYSLGETDAISPIRTTTSSDSVGSNGLYGATDRPYTDGENMFVLRDFYTVDFNKVGVYIFCETMAANGVGEGMSPIKTTKACSKITVKPPRTTNSDVCRSWAPASYTNSGTYVGTTSVLSQVINNGSSYSGYRNQLSGTYSGWRGQINEGTSPAGASISANKTTYARPGDEIEWANCYYPGVQRVASTQRTYTHGTENVKQNTSNTNYAASNSVFGSWQNQYTVKSESNSKNTFSGAKPSSQLNIGTGKSDIQYSGNTYTIKALNDTGKYFQETITSGGPVYISLTNEGIHSWPMTCYYYTTHTRADGTTYRRRHSYTCYYHHTNNYIRLDNRIEGPVVSGAARVEVPYNFSNTTGVSVAVAENSPVYSGESVQVNSASVTVGKKANSVVEDTYATQVDNVKVRLVAYVSSSNEDGQSTTLYDAYGGLNWCGSRSWSNWRQCSVNAGADGVALNYDSSVIDVLNGGTESNQFKVLNSDGSYGMSGNFENTYTVFDANAGEYMCFAMAVWPSGSGGDTNLDPAGDRTWAISKTCRVIAKKPSFQVYGGGVYANGEVKTITSVKYNLYSGYSVTVPSTSTIFGSVVEQNVIGQRVVNGLISGASTGLSNGGAGAKGSVEKGSGSFCEYRTALSFANYGNLGAGICPSLQITGNADIVHSTTDRASLVSYWVPADTEPNLEGGAVNWGGMATIASPSGRNIRYIYSTGDLTAGAVNVGLDTTYIVRTQRDIEITGNIIYSGAAMGSIDRIPKVVIYAAGNITIACGVMEVDAILIAGDGVHGGEVRTCGNYNSENSPSNIGDVNDPNRSLGQLNIRGMVIADKMVLGRTYGAAAGSAWSGLPAEAINYDTSAILWGRYMAGSAESDTLTVTYQHELAPRY